MTISNDDFLPVIPSTTTGDAKSDLRRTWRGAARLALANKSCATAIKLYKTNGSIHGHKVLDNAAAVTALIKAAPEELRTVLDMDGLNTFEKAQALDVVLRSRFEMDKKGKLTGELSQKYLAHQQKAQHGGDQA